MININIDGFNNKEDLLIDTLRSNKVDIALITETHRTPDNLQQKLNSAGYHMIENPTHNNSFNGCAILIKENLITDYQHAIIKPGRILKVEFQLQNHNYHIICVYLQSGSNSHHIHTRTEEIGLINDNIRGIQSTEDIVILGGDFNLIESPLDTAYPQHFQRTSDVVACNNLINNRNLDDTYRKTPPTTIYKNNN